MVLEAVLEHVCISIQNQAAELERAIHPALDALIQRVSSSNLEKVRRSKARLNRLTNKVEQIREVLEAYLNDDGEMREMYLNRRAARVDEASLLNVEPLITPEARLSPVEIPSPMGSRRKWSLTEGQVGSLGDQGYDSDDDIQEAENLLEAYFIILDNTYDKLNTLSEYIDDTEDYINIELDSHRNQLIQLELILTTATFAVAVAALVTGIFGMNIDNSIEENHGLFVAVTALVGLGSIAIFIGIVLYCRWKRLITW
mmetsp:Transcript_20778/g.58464  ORF Transcript_20778/g.58464 Transcript_20778/m.58464 type:complete len:257 (+) Transcript_20778:19-789(+)